MTVSRWRLQERPSGTVLWAAQADLGFPIALGDDHKYLLALADREGTVEHLYAAADWLSGYFTADDLLITHRVPHDSFRRDVVIAGLDIVDLAAGSAHEVTGLRLPLGFDSDAGERQAEYYHFITARPVHVPRGK